LIHQEGRKKLIAQVAEELFSHHGIHATTMDDIAKNAGISKKTLYMDFRSKNQLVEYVYYSKMEVLNNQLEIIVNTSESFDQKLIKYLETIYSHLDYLSTTVIKEIQKDYPKITRQVQEYSYNAVFNRFHDLISQIREIGAFNPDLDSQTSILLYRDAVTSLLTNQYYRGLPDDFTLDQKPVHVFFKSVVMIFRGMLSESGVKQFNKSLLQHPLFKSY
jgi:AcrR family transcriptional regulator